MDPTANALTSRPFIKNEAHRAYIDDRMAAHLAFNPCLVQALEEGKSVVFMFEGGSDNYPDNPYSTSGDNHRNQAVVMVVKRIEGKDIICFHYESASTMPAQPTDTDGADCSRQTTLLDGIYKIRSHNHRGEHGALQVVADRGYYTPPTDLDGWEAGAEGINIHTRNTLAIGERDSAWSWGCQLIGAGDDRSNVFNEFIKCVLNIDYDVWLCYSKQEFALVQAGEDVGYYVLDRQLALEGMKNLYTEKAIAAITARSRVLVGNE